MRLAAGAVRISGSPASGVGLTTFASSEPVRNRLMAGWFGIRGIGSLYYLMYAIQHGLSEELGRGCS